jgi:mono/diheme cytochrome c family protein
LSLRIDADVIDWFKAQLLCAGEGVVAGSAFNSDAKSKTLPTAVYSGACASCHGFDAKGFTPYIPALTSNPVVLDDNPTSLINLVLNGSIPLIVEGTPDAYCMPQFRQQSSDQDIADVITLFRNGWGNQAPAVTAAQVAKLRKMTHPTSDQAIILKMR